MPPVYDRNNIFAKILRDEAPCTKVYEDEYALAFKDIYPKAKVHVLAIPKGEYVSLIDFSQNAPADMVAGFWRAVTKVAESDTCTSFAPPTSAARRSAPARGKYRSPGAQTSKSGKRVPRSAAAAARGTSAYTIANLS